MAIVYVVIDLAKNVYAAHGVDEYGKPALVCRGAGLRRELQAAGVADTKTARQE